MRVDLAVVADGANTTGDGKLNILGVFGVIHALELPWRHPQMYLVVRFSGDAADQGQTKHLSIQLRDADGKLLMQIETDVDIPPDAGIRPQIDSVIGLSGVTFPKAGAFDFMVMINGQTEGRVPIEVRLAPPPEE